MLTPDAVSQARRAVRSALLLEAGDEPRWRWSGQVRVDDLVDAVARHRVAPLLAGQAEGLGLAGEPADAVRALQDRERLGALQQVRVLGEVSTLLAGIDHLALKGVALAVQTTGDPTARGAGDVDVLVSPSRLADAVELLSGAGWRPRPDYTTDIRSWAWRYQRWVQHEIAFDRGGATVDLHWRPDTTHDALPAFEDLWAESGTVAVGPVAVRAMGHRDTLDHSIHHAAKDGWKSLRSLVDIHRLLRGGAQPATDGRVTRATLTVVEATVGLPRDAPDFERTSSGLRRALGAQVHGVQHAAFPGQRVFRSGEHRIRSGGSPRDIAAAIAMVALPPSMGVGVHDEHALTAVPKALVRRLRRVGWRLSGWRTEL